MVATIPRPKVRRHRACAYCGRLKHPDGTPHGRALEGAERDAAVRRQANQRTSHGICRPCFDRVMGNV